MQHAHKQDKEYCELFVKNKDERKIVDFVFFLHIRSLWQDLKEP